MARAKKRDVNEGASITMALPQWDIDLKNHVLISESGTLEGGIEIRMPSTTLEGLARQIEVHRGLIDAMRNALPEGERARFMVEVGPLKEDVIDAYDKMFLAPDPFIRKLRTSKAEDLRERRQRGQLVEFRCFVLFTNTRSVSFLDQVMGKLRQGYEAQQYAAAAKRLQNTRARLFHAFSRHGLRPRHMTGQELFALAWRYFNPHERAQTPPTFVPTQAHFPKKLLQDSPEIADRTLRSQLTRTPLRRGLEYLRGSRFYTAIVSMEGLPVGSTFTGMANNLLYIPRTYWLVIDLEHRPHGRALRELHGRARRMTAAASDPGDLTDYADPENRVGASEADAALIHVTQTGAHFFKVGMSVIVQDTTYEGLEAAVEITVGELTKMPGLRYTRETFGLFEQYMNLSPGSGKSNDRTFQTLEENATAFLPTTTPWEGNKKRPLVLVENRWGSLSAIDPFDKTSNNWNGIVVGGSGSGKTFFMQMLANELMTLESDVIIIDRGGGYDNLIDLHGGEKIPLAPGAVSINPFDLPAGTVHPSDEKRSFLLALIKTMLRTSGGEISGAIDTILGAAIDQTYQRATRQERDEYGKERTVFDGCRLSDLLATLLRLEVLGDRSATGQDKHLAEKIATVLQGWTGDNPLGRFLDAETTIDPQSRVVGFETSGLMSNPQLAPIGIMLIANMVWERAEADRERHKLIVFDEVWTLLQIPEAAAFIVELYRRLRRYNAAAYTVTQSLEDFMTEHARGIVQSTTHFFLMKLRGEDDRIRDFFDLNPSAMSAFQSLTSRKGEFSEALAWIMRQDRTEGGIIRIAPHPLEYWAFTTDAQDMAMRDKFLDKHSGNLQLALADLAERYPKGVANT